MGREVLVAGQVLIVDSDRGMHDLIMPTLRAAKLQVLCHTTLDAASGQIRSQRPDLVLLGADLAKTDPTFCQQLRSCAPGERIPPRTCLEFPDKVTHLRFASFA